MTVLKFFFKIDHTKLKILEQIEWNSGLSSLVLLQYDIND